jgi:Bacterial regulatory proteins, luxR family/HD domain
MPAPLGRADPPHRPGRPCRLRRRGRLPRGRAGGGGPARGPRGRPGPDRPRLGPGPAAGRRARAAAVGRPVGARHRTGGLRRLRRPQVALDPRPLRRGGPAGRRRRRGRGPGCRGGSAASPGRTGPRPGTGQRLQRHLGQARAPDPRRVGARAPAPPLLRARALRHAAAGALGRLVGLHHERLDGTGYHRGVGGPMLPRAARILAAAVLAAAGQRPARIRRAWPRGLTDREVEVLRLVARGRTTRQIATELVVSVPTATTTSSTSTARSVCPPGPGRPCSPSSTACSTPDARAARQRWEECPMEPPPGRPYRRRRPHHPEGEEPRCRHRRSRPRPPGPGTSP